MKIRTTIFVLLCVVIMIISFAGCNKYNQYQVLELGGFDNISNANHKEEYEINLGKNESRVLASKEKSIEWGGEVFIGEYDKTQSCDYYTNDIDYYENKEKKLTFAVDSKNGNLKCYFKSVNVDLNTNYSLDECKSIAEDYVNNLINDFDEYVLESSEEVTSSEGYRYSFDFIKKIGELKSIDSINVRVHSSGQVYAVDMRTYGTLKDAELPEYDEEKVQEAIDKKLESIYENIYDENEVKFKEKERLVMKLDDGSMGLKISVDAEIIPKGTNSKSYYELTELIVCLGN